MYGLLYFYHAIQEALAHIGPLKKLLCIKAVLFLSFWQGILLSSLATLNIVHSTASATLEQVETELQDFLICIEMFFAALAHGFAYGYQEFLSKTIPNISLSQKLKNVFSTRDVIEDVNVTFLKQNQQKRE